MDSGRFQRIRAVFEAVADAPASEQADLLASLCGDDADLRREVEALLASDAGTADRSLFPVLAEALDEMPATLGRYRVVGVLGRGGMGVVYEAEQDTPRRRVALKTVHPWLENTGTSELLREEVQIMAEMLHPGIPQVYEVFDVRGVPVLAMELVRGRSLDEAIVGLSPRERMALLARIADVVEHAHRFGVVHRDLKPGNVLVTDDGQPKVLDFGIAQLRDRTAPPGSGTLVYMAPEQIAGKTVDARADVYMLGALGWEMLLGRPPVSASGLSPAALIARKSIPPRPPKGLARDLVAILRRALDPDPAGRYPSAGGLAADLRAYLEDRPVHARPGLLAWAESAARRNARRILAVAAVVAATAALGSAGILLERHFRRTAREEAAAAALARLRSEGDLAALDAFLAAPASQGTGALSDGFAWKAASIEDDDAKGAALVSAFVSATTAPASVDRLSDLARWLRTRSEWQALSAVTAALPDGAAPDLRRDEALGRWAVTDAMRWMSPEDRAIAAVLARARPLDGETRAAAFLEDGRLVRVRASDVELDDPDGQLLRRWPFPVGGGGQVAVFRGIAWIATDLRGTVSVYRLDPDTDAPPRLVETETGTKLAITVGDADGDGVPERYLGLGFPRRSLRIASPADGPSRPLDPSTDANSPGILGLALADADGDGRQELLAGGTDWAAKDLRIFGDIPASPALRERVRASVQDVAVAADPAGPRVAIAAGPLPPPGVSTPATRARRLVLGTFEAGRLVLDAGRALDHDVQRVRWADLDGDGTLDLVLGNRYIDTGTAVARRGADPLWLPGPSPLAAHGARILARDEHRTWLFGTGAPLVARSAGYSAGTPPARPAARAAWLADVGLATEGIGELVRLGAAGDADARAGAIGRLATLPATVAGSYASKLARDGAPDPALVEALGRGHRFSELRGPLPPRWSRVVEALQATYTTTFDHPPAWDVPDPAAVRWDALGDAVEIAAVAGRETAISVPIHWTGEALSITLDLDVLEADWSAGVDIGVDLGSFHHAFRLWRTGGGDPDDNRLVLGDCGGASPTSTVLGHHRVTLTALPGDGFLCTLDDRPQTSIPDGPPAGAADGALTLTPVAYTPSAAMHLRLLDVDVRGATAGPALAPFPAGDADGLRARAAAGGAAGLLAGGLLGAPDAAEFSASSEADQRFLLRVAPSVWTPVAVASLGPAAAARWAEAWDVALSMDHPWGRAAALDPALASIDLHDPAARRIALARAHGLLEAGRGAEAETLLGALRDGPDAAGAWWITARLRHRLRDDPGAIRAVSEYIRTAPSREAAIDRVRADPELAAHVPPDAPDAPILR